MVDGRLFSEKIVMLFMDKNIYVNNDQRENYIFNCQLNGIEEMMVFWKK